MQADQFNVFDAARLKIVRNIHVFILRAEKVDVFDPAGLEIVRNLNTYPAV